MATLVRPTWDEYMMAAAEWAKTRAACSRRQVGAAIFDCNHALVSSGYNGVAAGRLNCSEGGCPRGLLSYAEQPAYGSYSNCEGYHAEDNAIWVAHMRHLDLTDCIISVTHDPCANCTQLIMEAGITRVISPNKS